MKREIWDHEFRTWQGREDALYSHMMMCRDKSWLAVSRPRLSREEQYAACLHDLTPGVLVDGAGRLLSIELQDWAQHGLYAYRFFEGTFSEKMAFMRSLLEAGREVYVGTIHPLLPFSARYNPQIDRASYSRPNHIFVILGEEAGRYVYFDTSSYKSEAFEAYPNNPELGWISKQTVDPVLQAMFELGYTEWHEEKRSTLNAYADRLLASYRTAYPQAEAQDGLYRGRGAIERLQAYLQSQELDLAAPNWEHPFIEQGDMLNWKITDLATRRLVMAHYLQTQGQSRQAELWQEAGLLWQRLSTRMLYQREKRKYGRCAAYAAILSEILKAEDKICIFLQNCA